ncbi:uncharacterized protein [Euphorbia lathyris]|uniref:uncharacterized protein n=1 Tax=Euphorbia lathyris TaxID=212925 RepID=UPI003313D356
MKFVDGTLLQEDVEEANKLAWNRCNQLVMNWLNASVSTSIASSITWFETAYKAWQNLKDRFAQTDHLRIAELQDEIASLHQGDISVTNYYIKLLVVWEELVNFRPIMTCTCVPNAEESACIAIKNVREQQTQDCVIKFLRGLNGNFSMIKTQVLMMDPLPKIEKVFNMVVQHERQFHEGVDAGILGNLPNVSVNYAYQSNQNKGSYQFKKGNIKKCSYCGKEWHTVDQCYQKHGYPPNFKGKKAVVANVTTQNEGAMSGYGDSVNIG